MILISTMVVILVWIKSITSNVTYIEDITWPRGDTNFIFGC